MGNDFIENATPAFKKSCDRARADLATADLFTQTPDCAARTAAADIVGDASFSTGDNLTVEVQGKGLVARRGISDVARFANPPMDILKAVEASHGIAKGTVVEVHSIAGVVEISLC